MQRAERTTEKLLVLLLESQDSPLSGERLSEQLGVSRTAVWKAVGELRSMGYVVDSATNRGYRLTSLPNRLSPQLIRTYLTPPWRNELVCLEVTDSTNLYANRLVLDGAEDGTVVLAEAQTAGAGRLGRSFASEPYAGIYMSMILRPQYSAQELGLLTSCVGVAVCRAIEGLCSVEAKLKWPNDVMLGSRKVCGILTRLVSDAENNVITHAIVGVGINVLQQTFPDELADKAISLLQATGQATSRAQLAAAVIDRLNEMLRGQNLPHAPAASLLDELRRRSCTIGQQVRVVTPLSERVGEAVDIDSSGELLVRFESGLERVCSGEVSVRGLLGYQKEEAK